MSDAQYLIRKHGRYYRPNSQGYTASAIQAGRYTLAEAVLITHPNGPNGPRDGMTYVHEDEVRDDDLVAYRFLQVENAALQARADALVEALTPSGETKAAYMGEFSFTDAITDEDGNEVTVRVMVPWITVKEIMAAIRTRAAIEAARGK